ASAKNRAENVMIVDLMRNDLGRLAEIGSIAVPSLFEIERYPSVFQMTSTVTGRVGPAAAVTDLFTALFPAGSITGAPKTSSMRLIAEIERAPRGVYCGAIGFLAPNGDATFNVAIRTAVVDTTTGEVEYGVGGGITWDSIPGDEYAEALSKASFLDVPPVCSLLETMRLEGGAVIRLERHLRRLGRSAGYFGIPFDAAHVTSVLDNHVREHPVGARRARLLLAPDGMATVESGPFTPGASDAPPVPVTLARSPVSSQDRFLFHKTTHRAIYERQRASLPDVFDVLLWNERGEITEFTIGNVIVELDGRRYTPPVECGLLAGVFREELLDAGTVVERVITTGDLKHASRVWLVNSLREWVETCVRPGGSADPLT
ncbi:MAG: chorismate-binding protein, partial [Acidobacteria bacterium]|nr:chorismate-binding protein [Acidobacteriota bacterium]